jgi:hypothetical protein
MRTILCIGLIATMLPIQAMDQQASDDVAKRIMDIEEKAAAEFEEFFKKHRNPEEPYDGSIDRGITDRYKNLPLMNAAGEVVCRMDLDAPWPQEAVDENGNLKPGWYMRIPYTE